MDGALRSMRGGIVALVMGVASVLMLVSGCTRDGAETRIATSVREEGSAPPVTAPPRDVVVTQSAFIDIAAKVTPAVVNISASRLPPTREIDPFFNEFFGDFFRHQPQRQRREQSLGSGFIISGDGYILTNEHVVKGAEEIKVKLSDQSVYTGRLIGVDPRTDVAVIKIDSREKLTVAVLGDSEQLKVGQWAMAIGNPFGLDRTVTVGVISATGRSDVGIEDYEDFVQTDASINPGNSGGPLLNIYGEVVGINTAIVAAGQGIGFAIPINLAKNIANQLIGKGEVTRGWLGVSIQPLTQELAESFGLDKVNGALVNQVIAGSPADRAGLKRGDILQTFGGKTVRGVRELQLLVASTPVGRQVEMVVLRNGKTVTLPVTIAAQDSEKRVVRTPDRETVSGLGLSVLPSQEGEGVVVSSVDPRSAAASAGVQPGDLVLSVNRIEISSLAEFERAVRQASRGRNAILLLRRGDSVLYLALPIR